MRELACPICGGTARRQLYRETVGAEARATTTRVADPEGRHYRINRCLGCGLVYSSPIFDEGEVAALYTHSPHTNVRAGEEDNVRNTFRGYYRLARPHLGARKRILDIGCDMGLLLDMAAGDGFEELHGVEPNRMAAAVARAVPRSRIVETFYESTEYPEDHFDLVTLIHVVDHLVEPIRLLARVRRDLTPGGVVLAVVHNAGSLLARVLGERFPPYNLYHHYFFTKRTLGLLFVRAGLEPVWVGSTYNSYSLDFLVDKVPVAPGAARRAARAALARVGLGGLPLTLPLGNIGIVARKPAGPAPRL
jgi:2-polyprenyl-3-methyl-5-hydroxy-6-metoxy-1,4-benzoquinol methylase